MGICFASYGMEAYAVYSLRINLLNKASEIAKVVTEQKFYFYEVTDGGTEIKTDKYIDGFTASNLNYQFNDIVLPNRKYVLISDNGEYLGKVLPNGEIEKVVLQKDGGTTTIDDAIVYAIPDYATVLYVNGGTNRLIINESKSQRAAHKALYGDIIKVYDGMTAETGWAHPYTADNVNIGRIKYAEFGTATRPLSLAQAFKDCVNLVTVDMTNINTTDATTFQSMFENCRELTTMDITKLIVSDDATNIGGIFNNCPKYVINSTLSHWDTSNVTQFGAAFGNIGNTTFEPRLDTSSGETFNSMFGYNTKLTTLDLSAFDTQSATDFSYMFTRCEALTTIYAKPTFVQPTGVQGINMFTFDNVLVGGQGTVWDSGHVGLDRAYIDDLPSQPGYFTDKDAAVFKTTLFQNGTFIINESSTDREADIALYGPVVKEYDPLNAVNNYVFTNPNQVPWKDDLNSIARVKFGSFVQPTSTAYWFYNTINCQSMDFARLDTSKVTDMQYMFSGTRASSLDVSTFNTARVTDMTGMFSNTEMTSLDLSSWDTGNVTDMDYMFYDTNLTSLNISNFDTHNVTLMEGMFKNAEDLRVINCSSFDTSNVTNMKEMFYGCFGVEDLRISNFDTSNVTDMRNMFAQFGGMRGNGKTLDVSHFDTSKVTDMSGVFYNNGYSTIIVDGWDTSNVTNMSTMFNMCTRITELDLRDFDTSKVTNMQGMFQASNALVTIYVRDFDTSLVTNSTNMFFQTTSIVGGAGTTYNGAVIDKTYARNDAPPGSPGYFTGVLSTVLFTDGTLIINEDAEDRTDNITAHGAVVKTYGALTSSNPYVFADQAAQPWANERNSVRSVEFGTPVKPTSMAYWFNGLSYMTNFDVTNLDTSANTQFQHCFNGCSGLTYLATSAFNTSACTNMSAMFTGCTGMTAIDVTGFNTSNVTNMSYMFNGCTNLTSLDVSGFNTSNVTNMRQMFGRCNALATIDVSGFATNKVTNFGAMFINCTSVTALDVSNFNTSACTVMSSMFNNCQALTSLDVTSFDTTAVTDFSSMFNSLKLTTLDISSFSKQSATNVDSMFSQCRQLVTIYANSNFDVSNLAGSNMFLQTTSIVGGAGTAWNSGYITASRAKVDGGSSDPGYFTFRVNP